MRSQPGTPPPPPLVLVVARHEAGRKTTTGALHGAGFAVTEARTGGEALLLVKTERPEVVVLNVDLSDMDGIEVCRRIKENAETAHIPVLHVSASAAVHDQVRALDAGAEAHLAGPIQPDVLIATIRAALRARGAGRELARQASQWQTTFDSLRDGIALLDNQGRIARHNRGMERIAGAPDGGLAGRSYRELFPGHAVWDEPTFRRLRESREPLEMDVQEGERWLRLRLEPILDGAEALGGAVYLVADITDRRRLEEEFRQAQKYESIGELAGGVAHDFNNLLTGILGNASLALSDVPEGDPVREKLEEIMRSSERAAHLTRQLLAYSGKAPHYVRRIDLNQAITGIRHLLEAATPKKVALRVEESAQRIFAVADARQIEQVLMNLTINAGEAIGDAAGTIDISTGFQTVAAGSSEPPPGDYAYLEVADSGCGMDAGVKARIFDPFFTTKFMGRGMGLSAVSGIVKVHRGFIQVSSAPGKGSTFRVLLPAAGRPEEPLTVPMSGSERRSLAGKGAVLIAEDEPMVRRMAKTTLELYGYTVVVAENGLQAVEAVRDNPGKFTCVLMDMAMPVMGGEEAAREIWKIEPGMRVIVSTGYDETEAAVRFEGLNVAGFLQKPYRARELAEKMKSVTRSSGE